MKEKNEIFADKIDKSIVLKNFLQFTNDKALLQTVLEQSGKDSFTEKDVFELLKIEMQREVR